MLALITEFTNGITPGANPDGITSGPDGNLWFTSNFGIGRITPNGSVTEFKSGITSRTIAITSGPDGNLWFTENIPGGLIGPTSKGAIGRITPGGSVTEFTSGITGGTNVTTSGGITSGPDGNLWFTEGLNGIGRITPSGSVTEFTSGFAAGAYLVGITTGPDGNLWFIENFNARKPDQIGRITPSGSITEFTSGITQLEHIWAITSAPDGNLWFTSSFGIGRITPSGSGAAFSAGAYPEDTNAITTGPDGNLWFTGPYGIGRITPSGSATEFTNGITPGANPDGITSGPDGNLWFTEPAKDKISRLNLGGAMTPSGEKLNTVGGQLFSGEVATFSDGSPVAKPSDFTASIDWGDATAVSAGAILLDANGTFHVAGSHTYAKQGSQTIGITLRHVATGVTAQTSASVAVIPPAPTAKPDIFVLSESASSTGSAQTGVLANDVSNDGQPHSLRATVVSSAVNGTLTLNADGSFTYAPGQTFQGLDRFTYQVSEVAAAGQVSEGATTGNTATVTLISHQASIVDKLYHQVLGRSAEDQGLQYWTGRIMKGDSYSVVAEGIFESNERLIAIIAGGQLGSGTYPGYYPQFLLRPADPIGSAFWKGIWKRDGGPDHVISGMISSPEFYGSAFAAHRELSPNAAWVAALYERLLGREADAKGLAFWTDGLDGGTMTQQGVVLGFVRSDENFRNLTTAFFQQYLNRKPTDTELAQYVSQFKAGGSQRDVQEAIINLPEYASTPPAPGAGTVGTPLILG